jgi:hypothetical protein
VLPTPRRKRASDTKDQTCRILVDIPDPSAVPELAPSEKLARRWFAVIRQGGFGELAALMHEDVRLVSKVRPGTVVDGRDEVARFLADKVANSLYEAVDDLYTPVDDDRVIVEGRIRWIDDSRVIRDDPVIWAMEFRESLLLRFIPARTVVEAETILTSPR